MFNDLRVIDCKKATKEGTHNLSALEGSCHKPTSCFPSHSRRNNWRSDIKKDFPITRRGSVDIHSHG